MKSLIEKPKPGEFKAFCRLGRLVPLNEVLALPREEQPDTAHSHWNRKLGCEVVSVQCAEEFTDREAFATHMRELHDGGTYRWERASLEPSSREGSSKTFRPRIPVPVRRWKAPKLHDEGQPFDTTKHPVRECEGCGLIAEFDGTQTWELWWAEHTFFCVGQAAAS